MAGVSHRDKTEQGGTSFGDTAKELGHMAGNKIKGAADKVGEGAQKAGEHAESYAATATEKAKEAATYIGDKAVQATEAVGSGIKSLGGSIREHTPRQGMLHDTGEAVAGAIETSGRYLEEQGLKGIGEDFTTMVRRNPIAAVLIGVGLGFCLARMTRS
jgi:phage-related minor tail protein